ncbi:hypothetical protein HC62_13270 [Acetobacter tropicalis]|uniref:Uncharacterized protein n=1 Tax=Acetobacter tropicalis TaxID=104102 RepID=A0A252A4L3_9PROT|nr:hypothetical protein HC62_13270 [Acetobacter tropicalis]
MGLDEPVVFNGYPNPATAPNHTNANLTLFLDAKLRTHLARQTLGAVFVILGRSTHVALLKDEGQFRAKSL